MPPTGSASAACADGGVGPRDDADAVRRGFRDRLRSSWRSCRCWCWTATSRGPRPAAGRRTTSCCSSRTTLRRSALPPRHRQSEPVQKAPARGDAGPPSRRPPMKPRPAAAYDLLTNSTVASRSPSKPARCVFEQPDPAGQRRHRGDGCATLPFRTPARTGCRRSRRPWSRTPTTSVSGACLLWRRLVGRRRAGLLRHRFPAHRRRLSHPNGADRVSPKASSTGGMPMHSNGFRVPTQVGLR